MKISEVRLALERLGLSRHEILVFLSLARTGAATAGELARATRVNRVQTYRALDSLEARGLVEVTLGRPKRYAARAIEEVFEMLAEEKRAELEAIDAVRRGLLSAWPRIAARTNVPSMRLQILQGRAHIYGAIRRLVGGARREVLAFTTTKGLQRSYRAGINEVLVDAMQRGVRARLIADINESNAPLMARVAEHVSLRHADRQRGRFILVDGVSILAFLLQDERTIRGEGETAMWTNSPDFVKAHEDIFEGAWREAVPAKRRLAELRANPVRP